MTEDLETAIDPVGATEIAERAGVGLKTVQRWRERHADFPKPRWTVGGRPAWAWGDVRDWLSTTKRIKPITWYPAVDIDHLGEELAVALDAGNTPMLYSANGARIAVSRDRLTRFNVDGTETLQPPYRSWENLVAGVHYLLSQGWTREPLAFVAEPEAAAPISPERAEEIREANRRSLPPPDEHRPGAVAYRHELDDADLGETMAFGDDATGLADH